jgi:hypothetical protein
MGGGAVLAALRPESAPMGEDGGRAGSPSPGRRLKRAGPRHLYRTSILTRGGLAGVVEEGVLAAAEEQAAASGATEADAAGRSTSRGAAFGIKTQFDAAQSTAGGAGRRRASVAAALDMTTAPTPLPAAPAPAAGVTTVAAALAKANARHTWFDHVTAASLSPTGGRIDRSHRARGEANPEVAHPASHGAPAVTEAAFFAGHEAESGGGSQRAGRRLVRDGGVSSVLWSPEAPAFVRPATAAGVRPAGGAAAPRDTSPAVVSGPAFRPGRRPASAQWNRSSLTLG